MTDTPRTNPSAGGPPAATASVGTTASVALDAEATGTEYGVVQLLRRWWPPLLGLALGTVALLDIEPWEPSDPTTAILPCLAIAYLVFGVLRGQFRRPGTLTLEVAGFVLFGACALVAALVSPEAGHYIAGAGWIAHAAWDVAHHSDLSRHHAVGVVPRGWAEFCIVVDLFIGASLIAAPIA
jgi:hypothetical protein